MRVKMRLHCKYCVNRRRRGDHLCKGCRDVVEKQHEAAERIRIKSAWATADIAWEKALTEIRRQGRSNAL